MPWGVAIEAESDSRTTQPTGLPVRTLSRHDSLVHVAVRGGVENGAATSASSLFDAVLAGIYKSLTPTLLSYDTMGSGTDVAGGTAVRDGGSSPYTGP